MTKVCIRFQKSTPFIVKFKYNSSDEQFMELNISPKVQKKASNIIQGGNLLKLSKNINQLFQLPNQKKRSSKFVTK